MENLTYELAYHLIPKLDDAVIQAESKAIEDLIGQYGGFVLHSKKVEKKHLSYPIRHETTAYFGVIDFTVSPEKLIKINDSLKLNNHVLRSLIIKKIRPKIQIEEPAKEEASNEAPKAKTTRGRKTKTIDPETSGKIDAALDTALEKIDY